MKARIVAFAVLLALGILVAPYALPVLDEFAPVDGAYAAKICIAGEDPNCIIPFICRGAGDCSP